MNPNRKPLMAGNWKMYKTAEEAEQFVTALNGLIKNVPTQELPEVVLCPPYTALDAVHRQLVQDGSVIALGAQNIEAHEEGAYTGEISPRMLREFEVKFAIIGHSERRQYYNETDTTVNAKIGAALKAGITPIVCVGESLEQREAGQTDSWVKQQVTAALQGYTQEQRKQMVFAYEPIWAIGTGKVCEAQEANRVIGLIRQTLEVTEPRILYGGSMKPDNVDGLMSQPEIDGGLVGGASLEPQSFFKLIQAAMPVKV
jgi:triosephosphate isomerase (TIM)